MLEDRAASAVAVAFKQHLAALNSEFERLVMENVDLRKQLVSGNEMPSVLSPACSPSSPCSPTQAPAVSSFPGVLEGKETLWQIRSLDCASSPKPPIVKEGHKEGHKVNYLESPKHLHLPYSSATSPGSPSPTASQFQECDAEMGSLPGTISEEAGGLQERLDAERSPRSIQGPHGSPPALRSSIGSKPSRATYVKDVHEIEESEDNATFLLMLDVVPALVILANSVVAGISADVEPNSFAWTLLETLFALFFIGEIAIKIKVFGFKGYFFGEDWYWSWFDLLCMVLALIEMSITYLSLASGKNAEMGAMSSLKMLKLARLGRIIRLLKFKIFQELKLMIQGVFTGLRVLFWAVVLLIGIVYLLGVVSKTLFSDNPEFQTVPRAMFTSFRCFTDGCSTYDGAPLQEKLFRDSDFYFIFVLLYILLFLFVTIGIFNLIMAVFIDNVTDGSTKKRQQELGLNAPRTGWVIASELRHLILANMLRKEAEDEAAAEDSNGVARARRVSKIMKEKVANLREMYGYKPHTTAEYEELTDQIRDEMADRKIVVTRSEFNHWLSTERELLETLNEAEIDLSCKSDLFDVLDADLSGELEFEEMIDGLLKCRGPASKTDIIAIRLKTRLLVRMMTQICEKLGIDEG